MKKMTMVVSSLAALLVMLMFWIPKAEAESSFYSASCQSCHGSTPTTCDGCHAHGTHSSSSKNNIFISGATDKTTYAPGETVSVSVNGGYRTGWVRVILYDQNMVELKRSTGSTGMGGGAAYPMTLTATAPMTPGTYTWNVAWYGNKYDLAEEGGTTFFGPRWTPDPNNPNHGQEIVSINSFAVAGAAGPVDKVGVFSNGEWYLDLNSNESWNGTPADTLNRFGGGVPGAVPVIGNWTGVGSTKVGVYVMNALREVSNWYLDLNGNGIWDGPTVDRLSTFGDGLAGAVPVTGDWTGNGTTRIGVFANGYWYLDLNGNGIWDDTPTDGFYSFGGGLPGVVPVAGDWTGSGTTKIGVFSNGYWYLDLNGNGVYNGTATDGVYTFGGGLAGAVPVAGDWTGSGTTKIGVFSNGYWYLDLNGNGIYNGAATDGVYTFGGGLPGSVPVTGKW
jgi:hypothetical protein